MRKTIAMLAVLPAALAAQAACAQDVLEPAPVQVNGAIETTPLDPGVPAGTDATTFTASEAAADPYEDLYQAMVEGFDRSRQVELQVDRMMAVFSANPTLAKAERAKPGLLDAMRAAELPVIAQIDEQREASCAPQVIAILRSGLTRAEASGLAAMFRSPAGGLIMQFENGGDMQAGAQLARATKAGNASLAAKSRDVVEQFVGGLSPADRALFVDAWQTTPGLPKLSQLTPRIMQVGVAAVSGPPTAEERAEIAQAAQEAVRAHLGAAGNPAASF